MGIRFDGEAFVLTEDAPKDVTRVPRGPSLLQRYRRELRRMSVGPLTKAETARLVTLAQAGDRGARLRLIESLLWLGFWLAKSYRTLPAEEVVSLFNRALMESIDQAIAGYHPAREATLSSYVITVAKKRLADAVDQRGTVVSVNRDRLWRRRKVLRYPDRHDEPPRTEASLRLIPVRDRSLEEEIESTRDGDPLLLGETLAAPLACTPNYPVAPSPNPEAEYGRAEGRAYLREVFAKVLTPRQYAVMSRLYGLETDVMDIGSESVSESALAAELHTTKGMIKSIRQASLKSLRRVEGLHDLLRLLCTSYVHAGKQRLRVTPINTDPRPRSTRGNVKSNKLTPAMVKDIRRLWASGWLNKDLAKRYRVAPSAISNVTSHKTYKEV